MSIESSPHDVIYLEISPKERKKKLNFRQTLNNFLSFFLHTYIYTYKLFQENSAESFLHI